MMKHAARCATVALTFALACSTGSRAADAPMELKWAQLMPPAQAVSPLKPKTFFGGSTVSNDGGPPPPPLAEGNWMSVKRRQVGSDLPHRS